MPLQHSRKRSSEPEDAEKLRERIIGLGEASFRKSYYPELQAKIAELEKFKALLDQSNDAIFLIESPSGIFMDVTASACRQLGYTERDCHSKTIFDVVPENSEELKRILAGEIESLVLDTMLRKGSGERAPYEINMRRVSFGNRAYVVAVARDVARRKRTEEALRKSEERFRQLLDSAPMPVAVYDRSEKIIYLNKKFTTTFGYTLRTVPNLGVWWQKAYPDTRYRRGIVEAWTERVKRAAREAKEIEPMEATVTAQNGTKHPVEFYGINLGDIKMVILHDITEHKRAEEAIKAAKTQAELYLDLMAHDISNLNQTVLGFLELANDKLQATGSLGIEDSELIARPIASLMNSVRLIENLRKIEQETSGIYVQERIDVNGLLGEVVEQFAAVPGRKVRIRFTPSCECFAYANRLLKDVFSNLVDNAIKHSGGPLTIDIRASVIDMENRRFCRVDVEDDGPGIPDKKKARLFDFTPIVRQRSAGRGLGLYLVKTLVDDFHGKIRVEDRVSGDSTQGSRFVVMLPLA